MGCGGSKASDGAKDKKRQSTVAQRQNNQRIQEQVANKRREEQKVVKILLVGGGESGKSTILKQMKIINMGGLSDDDIALGKELVYKNTLDSIQALCAACVDLKIPYENPETEQLSKEIAAIDSSKAIPLTIGENIATVWKDPSMLKAIKRENEFHLLDSAKYFLNKVGETFTAEFVPTTQDILRTRLTTTGVIETQFAMEGQTVKMFDVGGQRGERKKWIHCFGDVACVMFLASLSEYDQVLAEDRTTNRMEESFNLFEDIINLPVFSESAAILFLNKNDIFEEKIKTVSLKKYQGEYDGPENDYDAALSYITDNYKDCVNDEITDKEIFTHVTDATNTENVAFVWNACKSIILANKVAGSGL